MKGIIRIGRDVQENQDNVQELAILDALDFDTISEKQMLAFLEMLSTVTASTLRNMQFANDCPYVLNEAENS